MRSTVLDSIIFGLQRHGGIANYWARLLDAFVDDSDLRCKLILPRVISFEGFKREWIGRVPVEREALSPRLGRLLRSGGCSIEDIFHTSYYRIPIVKPRRYVVTAYDFMYERYRKGMVRWVHTLQQRRSMERADVVSCISEFTRRDILELFPHIDSSRLKVVHLGVDTNTFYPDFKDGDALLSNTVMYVGLRRGYKRFDLAVESVRALPVPFILGIVGPALHKEERDYLDTTLGDRWQEFGSVSSDRLRELYSSVYALIFPSDCEGFGLPVLEAMACGCPVVASNCASLPEVGGDAALYAPAQRSEDYSDALLRLNVGGLRQHLIERGNSRVSEFTWAETCRKTKELYHLLD
jgi:mannosyltransferase